MKEVRANFNITATSTCPHCNAYIDVLDAINESGIGPMDCVGGKDVDIPIECPECLEDFEINKVEY